MLLREGLGCCCGMTLTASDNSKKDSSRGECANSALLTTLHSLHSMHANNQPDKLPGLLEACAELGI